MVWHVSIVYYPIDGRNKTHDYCRKEPRKRHPKRICGAPHSRVRRTAYKDAYKSVINGTILSQFRCPHRRSIPLYSMQHSHGHKNTACLSHLRKKNPRRENTLAQNERTGPIAVQINAHHHHHHAAAASAATAARVPTFHMVKRRRAQRTTRIDYNAFTIDAMPSSSSSSWSSKTFAIVPRTF